LHPLLWTHLHHHCLFPVGWEAIPQVGQGGEGGVRQEVAQHGGGNARILGYPAPLAPVTVEEATLDVRALHDQRLLANAEIFRPAIFLVVAVGFPHLGNHPIRDVEQRLIFAPEDGARESRTVAAELHCLPESSADVGTPTFGLVNFVGHEQAKHDGPPAIGTGQKGRLARPPVHGHRVLARAELDRFVGGRG